MKNIILISFLIIFTSASSCNQGNEVKDSNETTTKVVKGSESEQLKALKNLEKKLSKAHDVKDEMEVAKEYVENSRLFVEQFPKNKNAAKIAFRAADVARGIGNYGRAIQLWGKVWRDYPDFKRAPDAMFLQGFTYENNLKDYNNAKNYYVRFLEAYPKHELYQQAKAALSNLGKSPEDLIKEFKKNIE